ncbi:MAG: TIGR00341 family protein [Deltaproteobacteria bacterium]|uniref:TIGR00341 family protein n=1 Tax=Candidatus Zymogenus saltonus TaxID=2844893 RepID=A0A9D8PS75_9DELT|nr:TIGR00341 family protein [Candidatus Zymogenus saltonus]
MKKPGDLKSTGKWSEEEREITGPEETGREKLPLYSRLMRYFGLDDGKKHREETPNADDHKNKGHHENHPDKEDETTLAEKITSQTKEVREIIDHVINPEERTLKNYLSVNFWKKKREEYKKIKEKEAEDFNVHRMLSEGATPTIEYYILTTLSAIIATAGLIQGSTAVIIGAMIVAPLMTPILAFSLGVIWGDLNLIRNSTVSILRGTVLAVLISAGIAFFTPISGYSAEILARTRPDLFDVIIAIASGTVGAYGNANRKVSNTLVGIAIAVALMPPLCTIGIGVGTLNLDITLGAMTLFLINLISISLSSAVIFWIMRIHPVFADVEMVKKRAIRQIIVSVVILTAITIPVSYFMWERYSDEKIKSRTNAYVEKELSNTTVYNMEIKKDDEGSVLYLTLKGGTLPKKYQIEDLKKTILGKHHKLSDIKIEFIITVNL